MEPYEKVAQILRTDKDIVLTAEKEVEKILGYNNVFENIVRENKEKIEKSLSSLNITSSCADDIFHALLQEIKEDDRKLSELIHKNSPDEGASFKALLDVAKEASAVPAGRFLKLEKARDLLRENPPQKIMRFLGYEDVEELIKKEDVFEIFAGLRFLEEKDWLNKIFFKAYENITPDDFEEREITALVLGEKFTKAAEEFLRKKYHNLSHLKELGLIFIIPVKMDIPGAIMRDFTLSLHYYHEVKFYSDLFEKYTKEENFSQKFVSALRGDNLDERPAEEDLGKKWLIVQQYLAKGDKYDWRLFYPHVNPEAFHWERAERDVARLSERFDLGFEFWNGLGFVGDFYKTKAGVEVLVSFNLIDNAMALFQETEFIKYLYHHQESMWNKFFFAFFGEEQTEKMIIENFDKGIIDLGDIKK